MSDNSAVDLEAQPAPAVSAPTAHLLEYNNSEEPKPALSEKPQVSQTKKYTALAIYFAINLSLSTFNKQVLGQVYTCSVTFSRSRPVRSISRNA